jgi:hypothetical protein
LHNSQQPKNGEYLANRVERVRRVAISIRITSRSLAIVQQPAAQLYRRFVEGIKERIRTAQLKAALAANAELVLHYWEIGREILASQKQKGWGRESCRSFSQRSPAGVSKTFRLFLT